jgi:membrane-bound lytic murein transglycosylase D
MPLPMTTSTKNDAHAGPGSAMSGTGRLLVLFALATLLAGCASTASQAPAQRPLAKPIDAPGPAAGSKSSAPAVAVVPNPTPDIEAPAVEAPAAPPPPIDNVVAGVGTAAAGEAPVPEASAKALPDLWKRIEAGFAIADLDHPLVDRHTRWYLDRPDYVRRMVERSQRYLHFVVEELEKRNLPTELALLPMIESAYNPMAYSRARAAGMWQFIPSTGKIYGLEQDWWADQRRDVISSTQAALDYLERIYAMHGDWHLALASYNWGEGAVGRAVARNRAKGLPTGYQHIAMPAETRGYVPKLQAVKNILGNPGLRQMLELPSIPDEPYFVAIDRPEEMDVKLAAEFAEISLDEFVALNPAHNRPILRTDVPLLLPRDHVDRFRERVAAHDRPFLSWQKYIFQKSDRVDTVAKRFGLTEQQLRLANGLTGKRAKVVAGQRLMVPLPGQANAETLSVIAALPPFSITDPPAPRKGVRKRRTQLAALVPGPQQEKSAARKKTAAGTGAKPLKAGTTTTIRKPASTRG